MKTPTVGRVTGFLLIAAAALTLAVFKLPVLTAGDGSFDVYAWKSMTSGRGMTSSDFYSAAPYVLMLVVAGVAGTLLAVGLGARRGVLFWVGALAAGMVLQIASGDVVGAVQSFGSDISPGSGFWIVTVVMLLAIAALVTGMRDAVVAKGGAAPGNSGAASGGVADRVAAVFLVVAVAVDFGGSFVPLIAGDHSSFVTIWETGRDGSIPWPAVQFALGSIAVIGVAVALLAGIGLRSSAVSAASGAAASFMAAGGIVEVSSVLSVMGPNFWEYAGTGLWLAVLTLLLSFAATVAGLVAQLARPRMPVQPGAGYAPGFTQPGPNPFVPGQSMAPAPNPFAPVTPVPNPFASAAASPNPFAAAAPQAAEVEATVKISPPPRMAKVYEGKDGEGRPMVNRQALEGNTRTAVLAYLESAPIVLAARSFEQDEFAPGDKDVPLTFRTDGVWVWAGAVAHYLHKHGLPPEPELVAHIASRGFRVGEVGKDAQDAAIRVITGG
ncbi:hypothetical protein GPX89_17170 [Nocardia sp. ET3-3]|uniref:Uncharacterized protein n=1 Tax=Nocardia terrae TaxID=2675851 RepID=A0A7K1UXH0_9NOCA|nr:hypothetical protein [Nocardia terrae]MVU78971.1 hypothetical protein [Nocardia terrae]